MNASSGKVISPLCFTEYPGKQDFLQLPKSDLRLDAYGKPNFYLYNPPANRCHFRTRQLWFELLAGPRSTTEVLKTLAKKRASIAAAPGNRSYLLTSPHYVQTKLLLGMWYKAPSPALAPVDEPAILQ